jgi:uncharacterized protein YcfL
MTIRLTAKGSAALRELLRYADPQLVEIFRRAYPYDAEVLDMAPKLATREIVGDVVVH